MKHLLLKTFTFSLFTFSLQSSAQTGTFTIKHDKKIVIKYQGYTFRITSDSLYVTHYQNTSNTNDVVLTATQVAIQPDSNSKFIYSIPNETWLACQNKTDSISKTITNMPPDITITIMGSKPGKFNMVDFGNGDSLGDSKDPVIIEAKKILRAFFNLSRK
jgi:hypothetical protein